MQSRLELLRELVEAHGPALVGGMGSDAVSISALVGYCADNGTFSHANGDIRRVTEELFTSVSKVVGGRALLPQLEATKQLRPKQMEEYQKAFQEAAGPGGAPLSAPTAIPASRGQAPQSQSASTAAPAKGAAATGGAGGGKPGTKPAAAAHAPAPAPSGGVGGKSGGAKAGGSQQPQHQQQQAQKGKQQQQQQQRHEEPPAAADGAQCRRLNPLVFGNRNTYYILLCAGELDGDGTCQFCGGCGPGATEAELDLHYWQASGYVIVA